MATGSWSARNPPYTVLLAAYGSPRTLDEVEPYLHDVRGGRPVDRQVVEALRRRYAAIGGHSPLLECTSAQADALARALNDGTPVYVGMRHWHPYIHDVMARIREEGHRRVVAIPLAPHYSRMSIGAYRQAIERARGSLQAVFVRPWHDHPGFLDAVTQRVVEGLERFDAGVRDRVALIFTGHSLPQHILRDGDPYPEQLRASIDGVLDRLGGRGGQLAFQSAGQTDEPWLGPDASQVLSRLAAGGTQHALLCPIGFVSDHLEVLYDVDIELQALARRVGIHLERTASLNDWPAFISVLASLVHEAASTAAWT